MFHMRELKDIQVERMLKQAESRIIKYKYWQQSTKTLKRDARDSWQKRSLLCLNNYNGHMIYPHYVSQHLHIQIPEWNTKFTTVERSWQQEKSY